MGKDDYYDASLAVNGKPLFVEWEKGERSSHPGTPSVRLAEYRIFILTLFKRHVAENSQVISLGCGNGFTERLLKEHGFQVLGTDVHSSALQLCREKGVDVRHLDVLAVPDGFGVFDVVYSDGLMGHLWDGEAAFSRFIDNLLKLLAEGGIAILSNDLSDSDNGPCTAVTGAPEATFYRGVPGYVGEQLGMSDELSVIEEHIYEYERKGRGLRRREIVVARRLN
jgi:SAM-dependent methyltransferase